MTDIFAPNVQAVAPISMSKGTLQEQLRDAAQEDNVVKLSPKTTKSNNTSKKELKSNTDSGYYGKTDDEKESDDAGPVRTLVVPLDQPISARREKEIDERCISDASFVSAKEDFGSKVMSREQSPSHDEQREEDDDNDETIHPTSRTPQEPTQANKPVQATNANSPEHDKPQIVDSANIEEPLTPSDGSSPEKPLIRKSSLNFASLPAREPLTGKKSLGPQSSRPSHFSGMTNRTSHIARSLASSSQDSNVQVKQETKPKGSDTNLQSDDHHMKEHMDTDPEDPPTKLHNKTSTQRLHDRITMLGQSKEPRPSKSMAPKTSLAQPNYPRLPMNDVNGEHAVDVHSEDKTMADASTVFQEPSTAANESTRDETRIAPDHIQKSIRQQKNTEKELPPRPMEIEGEDMSDHAEERIAVAAAAAHASPERPGFYGDSSKASSFTALPSAVKYTSGPGSLPLKTVAVSNPEVQQQQIEQPRGEVGDNAKQQVTSTTPPISPKRHIEGPLSASKAKLYSVLKSAKGIFASSASVSAQARLEMLTPPRQQQSGLKGNLATRANQADTSSSSPNANESKNYEEASIDRKQNNTTSNTLRAEPQYPSLSGKVEREDRKKEKGAKEILRLDNELEKARAKEREKATIAAHKTDKPLIAKMENVPALLSSEKDEYDMIVESNSRSMIDAPESSGSLAEMPPPTKPPTEARRPTKKPSKDTLPRAKPAPVSIKVASQLVSTKYTLLSLMMRALCSHSNTGIGGTHGSIKSISVISNAWFSSVNADIYFSKCSSTSATSQTGNNLE